MRLTYLQYQLPYYGIVDATFQFRRNGNIQGFSLWEEGISPEADRLYLGPAVRQGAVEKYRDALFCVWGCGSRTRLIVKNAFYLNEEYSFPHIHNILSQLFQDYHTWELMLQYSDEVDLGTLLDQSEKILRMPLAIADNRFHFLAKGDTYRTRFPTDCLDPEEMDEFFWQEEFRSCTKRTHVFHLPLKSENKDLLCFNIIIGGQFYARLLGSIEDVQHAAIQEKLFNRVAVTINSIFANQRVHLPQAQNPELQKQIELLLQGSDETDVEILDRYGWKRNARYSVMVLSFDASYPLEEGVRFLVTQVRELFPECCVVAEGRTLLCIRNLDREPKNNLATERLSVFLRENIAKAGVSDVFTDYQNLPLYRQQALEALRLGSRNDPHFWHYEFHTYIMEYLIERMIGEYPTDHIVHPGLYALQKYDREKGTDLFQTLECYLKNDCNASRASESLFIHRSSLMKRLDKIQSLTGINTRKEKERLYVNLSLQILEYQKKN